MLRILTRGALCAAATLMLSSSVTGGSATAEGQAFADWEAELKTLRKEHAIPGMAVAVVRDGSIAWSRGFGVANVDEEVPVTPDTPFWIASITKTFVGLSFLQLEEDGIVDLDEPLQALPGFTDFCSWLAGSSLPFGVGLDCKAPLTARTILTHTSNGAVGHEFLYNPLMYSRLSRYLEWKVNGSTEIEGGMNELARQIEQRILAPTGMRRSVASQWDRSKMAVVYDMARGYGVEGEGENRYWALRPPPKRALAGGAGIVSTVEDLGRYMVALESGELGSRAIMSKLLSPPLDAEGRPLPYAYGWYVQEHRGERLAFHTGWDEEAGTSSLLVWLPERRTSFVVLANGEGVRWQKSLSEAGIEGSTFAKAFLDHVVFAEAELL